MTTLRNIALLKNINFWIYFFSIGFIVINAYAISQENFFVLALPFVLLIVVLGVFAMDKLVYLVVFLTPLSIPLQELVENVENDMYLPTEPILFGLLILFLLKLILERKFDRRVFSHPISIAIYLNLLWLVITTITSSMPVVSIKFVIARLWFLATFYFIATQIFRKIKNIRKYLWLYIIPLIIVIGYTIWRLYSYGLFNHKVANYAVSPFYNDHTSYGAALAMILPILLAFVVSKAYRWRIKAVVWLIIAIFVMAIIFSYTRASWVSIAGALGVLLVVRLKIKFRYLAIAGIAVLSILWAYQSQIVMALEKNHQDSSKDLAEHVKSISNVYTDASNLERLNRWNSAFKMFEERPVFGWGPGTYMFQYAPYQNSKDRTIISTNAGDGGNAHSEYIGPLAEGGVLGTLSFIAIIIVTILSALRVYNKTNSREVKILVMSVFLGLVTYWLHGFLNNFLDTDKASALFWGFSAVIVALDIYHKDKSDEEILSE